MSVRVAVVGAGLMGRLHAEIYQAQAGVELRAIVEPDVSTHDELRAMFDVPVHENVVDLAHGLDAISICTPDHIRRDEILLAFDRGLRVLVEKPLATSLNEAHALVASRPSPDALMVGHLLRFDPRVQQAREAVCRGDIGDIWSIRCWRNNSTLVADRIAPRTSVDWFLGIHDVDMVRYVTGLEISAVRATAENPLSANRDLVRGELMLAGGPTVQFCWSWLLPAQRSSGLQAGIEIIGSTGMLEVDLSHNAVALTTSTQGRQAFMDTYHWPTQYGVPAGDLRQEIQAFLDTPSGLAPPVTAEDGLQAVTVISAVEAAAESGDVTEVPATFEPQPAEKERNA